MERLLVGEAYLLESDSRKLRIGARGGQKPSRMLGRYGAGEASRTELLAPSTF